MNTHKSKKKYDTIELIQTDLGAWIATVENNIGEYVTTPDRRYRHDALGMILEVKNSDDFKMTEKYNLKVTNYPIGIDTWESSEYLKTLD